MTQRRDAPPASRPRKGAPEWSAPRLPLTTGRGEKSSSGRMPSLECATKMEAGRSAPRKLTTSFGGAG
eukprot:9281498-Pyramimonas_sp.AAC.1